MCEYLKDWGGGVFGLLRECVNNWVSERILSEGMSGWVSQWVSGEMREQSSEQVNVWSYESEWVNVEVCELMSEN